MRDTPAPEITVEGELSDAAIEAIADLLIDAWEREQAEQEEQSARC